MRFFWHASCSLLMCDLVLLERGGQLEDHYDPFDRSLDVVEGRNYALIMGVKRNYFVEFEFIAGDPTLTVELVLPIAAFVEFCSVNDVQVMPPADDAIGTEYISLCDQYGVKPGRPDTVLAR